MVGTMAGHERDLFAFEGAHGDFVAGSAVWSLDNNLFVTVEQFVEAGASENTDLSPEGAGGIRHCHEPRFYILKVALSKRVGEVSW